MNTAVKLALALAMVATCATAQRRDPLNSEEINQLRETAQEPVRRLPLMLKFASARMEILDHLRSQTASPDRVSQIREALQDFETLMDQLNDNIDDYADRGEDLRKPLKEIIQATAGFQTKLQAWKTAGAGDPAVAQEFRQYSFLLDNALDAVSSSLENAQQTLADQTAHASELKKKK